LARPALVASPISLQPRNRPCLPQEQEHSKSDQQELDQLESGLEARVSETRPSPDLDLVTLVSEAFLRRFGLDTGERLAEIAGEFGIEVLYHINPPKL
jgi:hypothetical protein